jgi:hypothetical protein
MRLDELLFARIAGLARVPAAGIEKWRQAVSYEIDREWSWYAAPPTIDPAARKHALMQLRHVEQLSSKLRTVLRSLDTLALTFLISSAGEYDVVMGLKMIDEFAGCPLEALRLAEWKPKRKSVGRPASSVFSPPYHRGSMARFTLRLLWDAKAAGGSLTLDKNTRKGTLVEALNLLRPYLPPDFVPNVLPVTTLARLKAVDKKLAVASNQYPWFLSGYWTKK